MLSLLLQLKIYSERAYNWGQDEFLKYPFFFEAASLQDYPQRYMRKYWVVVPCLLSQWVKEGYILLSPFYSSVTLPVRTARALCCCEFGCCGQYCVFCCKERRKDWCTLSVTAMVPQGARESAVCKGQSLQLCIHTQLFLYIVKYQVHSWN